MIKKRLLRYTKVIETRWEASPEGDVFLHRGSLVLVYKLSLDKSFIRVAGFEKDGKWNRWVEVTNGFELEQRLDEPFAEQVRQMYNEWDLLKKKQVTLREMIVMAVTSLNKTSNDGD